MAKENIGMGNVPNLRFPGFTEQWETKKLGETERLIENYLFTEREPLRDELLSLRKQGKPSVLKFKETGDRILNKILEFVDTFVNGFSGS